METNGESKDEEMPPLERTIDEDIAIVEGQSLVLRQALSIQIKEYDTEQ